MKSNEPISAGHFGDSICDDVLQTAADGAVAPSDGQGHASRGHVSPCGWHTSVAGNPPGPAAAPSRRFRIVTLLRVLGYYLGRPLTPCIYVCWEHFLFFPSIGIAIFDEDYCAAIIRSADAGSTRGGKRVGTWVSTL